MGDRIVLHENKMIFHRVLGMNIVSLLSTFLFALLLCTSLVQAQSEPTRDQPNVLLIMADDLGYNDLSCYGSKRNRTPVLDEMARQGMRLTSFYAGAAVCSPSRMALLSGAYATRLGWEGGVVGYGMKGTTGLSTEVVTLATVFKVAGYRTAMSGKWHIGTKALGPMHHGFEETYYILNSNNMSRDLYRGDQLVHEAFNNTHLTETFTQEVIRLIKTDSDKPFFIYVPFTAPHFPADAHPQWKGKSQNGAYGDVVEEMDHRIGQILQTLKERKIDDRTLVIFISDNGPEPSQRKFASAEPFSGTKWSSREGGTRVPCIVRWPGVIKPGQVSDQIVSAIDLYPTLAHVCKAPEDISKRGQKVDGVNVWETLMGNDAPHPRTELLYWHGMGQATAIRRGDWKLFFGAGTKHGLDPDISQGPALFNLKEDPGETTDLRARHPQLVKELLELARKLNHEIHQNRIPLGDWSKAEPGSIPEPTEPNWGRWLR